MRSEWWVSLIAVLVVIGGLAAGAFYFRRMSQGKKIEKRIALIESLRDEGKNAKAFEQIEALLPKVREAETRKHLEWLAIQTLMRDKKNDEARRRAEAFLKQYPGDPKLGTVHYCLGYVALEADRNYASAGKHFQAVTKNYPDDPFYPAAMLGLANLDVHLGTMSGAKEKLDRLIEMDLDPEIRQRVEKMLGEVNMNLLLSRSLLEGDEFYEVKPNDNPTRIARQFGIEVGLLISCNNITNPRALPPGRRLKIPKVNFSIVVDLSQNTLALLNEGKFFKKYRVRTGKSDRLTPTGQFTIRDKMINPRWNDPDTGKSYPGGHPENELGSRWLEFDRAGLGIHGTIHPDSIGQYASRGCVGMLKEDVEELFDLVPRGTPVTITGQRTNNDYSTLESSSGSKEL